MAKLEISKSLLVGLVGIAAAAVLGLVFMLGREMGRSAPPVTHQNASGATGTSAIPSPASATATETVSQNVPEPQSAATRGAGAPLPAVPSGITNPPSDAARAAVATYFLATDNIQPELSGDPDAVAQQVVAGLGKGDVSGLDHMIQQAQVAQSRLSAIAPPQPCAAYHRESLACMDASLDLMRAMKKLLSSSGQDASALNLTDQANAMKARSEALQLQEKALKQRYGLMK